MQRRRQVTTMTVFNILRCYQCRTFQVVQRRKDKKWRCKVCGEKQSITKSFGSSSRAKDCRLIVQELNMKRGEIEQERMELKMRAQEDAQNARETNSQHSTFEDHVEKEPGLKASRWGHVSFPEEEEEGDDEGAIEGDHARRGVEENESTMFSLDADRLLGGRRRRGKKRCQDRQVQKDSCNDRSKRRKRSLSIDEGATSEERSYRNVASQSNASRAHGNIQRPSQGIAFPPREDKTCSRWSPGKLLQEKDEDHRSQRRAEDEIHTGTEGHEKIIRAEIAQRDGNLHHSASLTTSSNMLVSHRQFLRANSNFSPEVARAPQREIQREDDNEDDAWW